VHQSGGAGTGEVVRIGHPSGVFPVRVCTDGVSFSEVSFSRTARRLMDGQASVRVGTRSLSSD
jgi:2-methylaconitate cis-trans-isomerase PrpF